MQKILSKFQDVKFFHIFKFINFYVNFFRRYFLPSPVHQSFVIISPFTTESYRISHIFKKIVKICTRVILCNTLKKEGRAFRNIGKHIPIL